MEVNTRSHVDPAFTCGRSYVCDCAVPCMMGRSSAARLKPTQALMPASCTTRCGGEPVCLAKSSARRRTLRTLATICLRGFSRSSIASYVSAGSPPAIADSSMTGAGRVIPLLFDEE